MLENDDAVVSPFRCVWQFISEAHLQEEQAVMNKIRLFSHLEICRVMIFLDVLPLSVCPIITHIATLGRLQGDWLDDEQMQAD